MPVEAAECSWSGRRLLKSIYSQVRIFCTSFGGIAGHPGMAMLGVVDSDSLAPADVEGMGPNAADARFSDGAKVDAEENVGRPKRAIADAGGIEPAVAELVGPGEVWGGEGVGVNEVCHHAIRALCRLCMPVGWGGGGGGGGGQGQSPWCNRL